MSKELNIVAIIPARGGSKRVPNKNIRSFCGEPIIKYSIDTAIKSKIFDEVMVSTDSAKIASLSKKYGASVPFMRSEKNSSDSATIAEAMLEVIKEYEKRGITFKYFCCIFATAPLMENKRLKEGYNLIKRDKIDSVMPVVEYDYPIQRALKIKTGRISMIQPENLTKRSQELPITYHDAAKFYFINTKKFLKHKDFFMPNSCPIILPKSMAQDIDDIEDFKIAELKYSSKNFKFDWLGKEPKRKWGKKMARTALLLALLSSALIMGSII